MAKVTLDEIRLKNKSAILDGETIKDIRAALKESNTAIANFNKQITAFKEELARLRDANKALVAKINTLENNIVSIASGVATLLEEEE